jgi:peptidoglycan/LPS O-acetylase OafA/YrhL
MQRIRLQAIVIPLIVTGTVLNSESWPGRIPEFWPLRFVGRISYSLYIWPAVLALPTVPIAIRLGSLLAAVASYYPIERPFIGMGARLVRRQALAKTVSVQA